MALDWANERYEVRLYTRDTPNWTVAPWEARAVLPLILRKLDRKGILDLGPRHARAGHNGVRAARSPGAGSGLVDLNRHSPVPEWLDGILRCLTS